MNSVNEPSKAFLFYKEACKATKICLVSVCTPKGVNLVIENVGKWRNIVNLHMPGAPGIAIETTPIDPPTILRWPTEQEMIEVKETKLNPMLKVTEYVIDRNGRHYTYRFK